MSAVDTHKRINFPAFDAARARAARALNKAFLRRVLMIGGVALVLGVSAYVYLNGGRYIGSDDSYVHANKLMVSTDVSGLIKSVDVKEGQDVKKGDVLFTLDPLPFQIALDNANAMLAQAVQDVESTRATYRSALGQFGALQAQVTLTKQTYDRYAALDKQNAIAATYVDQARGAMLSAEATLASLQQTAATQLAKLNGNPNLPAQQAPEYLKAKAAVDEAQRQLDHAVVRAPFDGVVGEVDLLQPGTLVISAMSAFTTTSAVGLIGKEAWVEADMKETDLTNVHPGNPVDITIDTYPGRHLDRPCRYRQRRQRQRLLSPAGGKCQRQLGQGGPAFSGAHQHRPEGRRSAAAGRHERGGLDRHRQAPPGTPERRIPVGRE